MQLYGSHIPVDDRTPEEVERDEVIKEFQELVENNIDIGSMLPVRERENILGKSFNAGRRHQLLPQLKPVTHHPPTQVLYQS